MANAIKKISVQRGYDVTRYALNCFGGAGGQHACLVADALGMTDGADPSVLVAAVGLRHGPRRHPRHAPAGDRGSRSAPRRSPRSSATATRLGKDASDRGRRPGRAARPRSRCIVRAHIRYAGTDTRAGGAGRHARHDEVAPSRRRTRRASASSTAGKQLVVEAVSVEAVGGGAKFREQQAQDHAREAPLARPHARNSSRDGKWHEAAVYTRDQLAPGHKVNGPAIIIEPHQTIVVEHGWQAAITAKNHLVLTRVVALPAHARRSAPRPIRSCSRCSTTCSCRSPSRWA